MANGGTFPYYDAKEFDCRIIGLPYKHNLTTMYIIVPNNSNRMRLRQMQQYLTADKIEDMISKMEWKTAIILLPRMHISNKMNLKQVLQNMGVHSIFDRSNSDLSLISQGHDAAVTGFASSAAQAAPYMPNFPSLDTNYKFQSSSLTDDDTDVPFIFSRHGEDDDDDGQDAVKETTTAAQEEMAATTKMADAKKSDAARRKRNVSYKVPSSRKESTLRLKDYLVSKRITKPNPGKKHIRTSRQVLDASESLKNLDQIRAAQQSTGYGSNPGLFAEEIIHKIDLTVNEKGTEGGAATVTFLYRTGTDAVVRVETPFIFMIRHDDTKLPLFYGTVYEPTDF